MNMKTAQDISPSAIVCLSLGLLIGNVLLPEHQISGYISWQPSMEATGKVATGVDVSKGRLLERLPESYSPGVLSEALSSPLAGVGTASFDKGLGQEALVVHSSTQELTDLVARITEAYVVLASDWIVMLVLVAFAALAIPIMKIDVDEMVAQVNQDVEYTEADVTQTNSNDNGWLSLKTIIFICAAGLSAFLAGSTSLDALVQEPSLMPAGTQELTDLVARIAQADFSLAPDWIVMTVLGAFAVLAIPIMKIDMDEMAEPVEEGAKHAEAEVHQTTGKNQGRLTLQTILFMCALGFSAIGLIAGSTSLDSALVQEASLMHPSTQELTDLVARIAQADLSLAPDWIVMTVLGAFAVLSTVVMKIDMDEMAEQIKEDVKHTRAEVHQTTGKDQGQLTLTTILFMCTLGLSLYVHIVVGATSLDTALVQEASLMHPSTQELMDLAARIAQADFALALDWIVMLALGSFAVLSIVVMKFDMDEMAEQVQEDVKHTKAEVHQTSGKDQGQLTLKTLLFMCALSLSAVGLIVGSTSLVTAVGQEASPVHANTQELTDLVARIAQAEFALAPDWIVMLVLVSFTVLSMVFMKIDMDEMAEQVQEDVKHTEAEIAQPTSEGNGWLSLETIFFVCAGLIVGSASLDTALSQEASLMHPGTQELTDLVARMALSEFAFAPDWIVILVLGAFAVLSMVVMKIDMDEMSEQVKEDVKHTEVEVAQVQEEIKHNEVEVHQTTGKGNGWPSLTDIIFVCAAFLIVGSASLETALGQEASLMSASARELTDLVARIAQTDFVLAPDWIVILVLGAFTVLSKVVMKSDMDEMTEQVRNCIH